MGQGNGPRMTLPTQFVIEAFLADPRREMYGLELCEVCGLASGTVHPILARLEGLGWLESAWEAVDPQRVGRPARRYYRLTALGAREARVALARAHAPRAFVPRLRPAGGSA